MNPNTLFIRLEGPLQAWGTCSRFKIRETASEPTKSGVVGLICCAMGLRRQDAEDSGWLKRLNGLEMGVRVDRPGWRWSDYHTVAAGYGVLCAGGWIKRTDKTGDFEGVESWREYLCDASFIVALRAREGSEETIHEIASKLTDPEWVPFLGRKCCPPSRPLLLRTDRSDDLMSALQSVEWEPRSPADEMPPDGLRAVLEVEHRQGAPLPARAEPRQDVAVRFRPPLHHARYVLIEHIRPDVCARPHALPCPPPYRGWANYKSPLWRGKDGKRAQRFGRDHDCCVFCGVLARTVHHRTYANAPDHEDVEQELRSLCDLCHSAVTMLEYGLGMQEQRIDPLDPRWRDPIVRQRDLILRDRVPLHLQRKRVLPDEEA